MIAVLVGVAGTVAGQSVSGAPVVVSASVEQEFAVPTSLGAVVVEVEQEVPGPVVSLPAEASAFGVVTPAASAGRERGEGLWLAVPASGRGRLPLETDATAHDRVEPGRSLNFDGSTKTNFGVIVNVTGMLEAFAYREAGVGPSSLAASPLVRQAAEALPDVRYGARLREVQLRLALGEADEAMAGATLEPSALTSPAILELREPRESLRGFSATHMPPASAPAEADPPARVTHTMAFTEDTRAFSKLDGGRFPAGFFELAGTVLVLFVGWVLGGLLRRRARADSATRSRILSVLAEEPGQTVTVVAEHLVLARQTVQYHLDLLAKGRYVTHARRAGRKVWYAGSNPPSGDVAGSAFSPAFDAVIAVIASNPGIHRSEIARRLGKSGTAIRWHVCRAIARGLVIETRDVARGQLFAAPALRRDAMGTAQST